ncbi:glycoside hydrolase family 88/105 protein [Paenibacillus sedimenti]|uniref:Glycoside hydrolase family 88 protein n=1 Tax=Paenibacillus sedimenti TaxID=2770274 RepID=A0A926KRQ2_9BACL|nr:glycoside hydrolase family 88 protein [Paenibacillus sedimenti]MBD0380840.1 glycoside hydrolase family 88 protein [Paenibacillus sedimenti]
MLPYFHEQESISRRTAGRTEDILAAVAGRFLGAFPKLPPVYRTHSKLGFKRGNDCRYEMNLSEKFPHLLDGQYVYVWGKLWCDQEGEAPFSISCYSPVHIYVNGEVQFRSNLNDDVFPDRKTGFRTKLVKGWNHFVLRFVKTGTGCGGRFGTASVKGAPFHFLAPTAERDGQEGWIYSVPQDSAWTAVPGEGMTESASGIRWYPQLVWSEANANRGVLSRLFGGDGGCGGAQAGEYAYAWSKLTYTGATPQQVVLSGIHSGRFTLFVDNEQVPHTEKLDGTFETSLLLTFGTHDLVVQSEYQGDDSQWGIMFNPLPQLKGHSSICWTQPYPIEGLKEPWLYLGPFAADKLPELQQLCRVDTLFGQGANTVYWRADEPETWIRPYLENGMFGKWNYPLGVTLYGLLETGRVLSNDHFVTYVKDHIESCTRLDAYALWDQEQYGAPGTNHQLTLIDSLDDCGSFGATMLLAHQIRELEGVAGAAKRIADYITRVQDRMPDGALYRVRGTTDFMQDTMWCDDLYMSTPFLCRYYEMTGERSYLDDAANQFLLYKKRLFMPEQKIMHHVYDYKFNKPNGVAWGRGNGWVLFSLTELLAVMPDDHELRDEVLYFYRDLCEGYLRLQGKDGLWHQVLTDPESYAEASCTSMFIYAFSRGVRFGWLTSKPEPYMQAVLTGWDGIVKHCIDNKGNVYGVCRESGYSYSKSYYKDELTWQLNDTHGIGIVLLAGIETIKMRQHFNHNTT